MIQPNELRIGNWYLEDGKHFRTIENGEHIDYLNEKDEPIHLTPAVLKKAGFEATDQGTSLRVLDGRISVSYSFEKWNFVLESEGHRTPLHVVDYLHQLQNLYYALTGTELNIRL